MMIVRWRTIAWDRAGSKSSAALVQRKYGFLFSILRARVQEQRRLPCGKRDGELSAHDVRAAAGRIFVCRELQA
jgi:hypothetical protein